MSQDVTVPMASTVISIAVASGDEVPAGALLVTVDVMKMEHQILAPTSCRVAEVLVEPGQLLTEGQAVVAIEPSEGDVVSVTTSPDAVPNTESVAELVAAIGLTLDSARPEAVAKRRSRGQRTARENVADLCDDGTFVEYGQLAVAAQRGQRDLDELRNETPADGIVTGIGKVDGRSVAVLAVDATVIAGTQGFWHHHKIDRILDVAKRDSLPVVYFTEGGGGRPYDPDVNDVFTAGLHITSFARFAALSGQVPLVAIVSGRCFAGSAAFAGCADVIIATEGSNLGMAGPAMVEGGGMGSFAPEHIGPAAEQATHGVVDILAADEAAAVTTAKQYLRLVTGDEVDEVEAADQAVLRSALPTNRRQAYDMRPLLETLFDADSLLELRPDFGKAVITGFASLGGKVVGVLASNPMHNAGAIGPDDSDKAAKHMRLCDSYGIPIVSICDTPGFMVGPEVETEANVRHVSRMFVAGASLSVPMFGVIVRKAYGLGAMALLGGNLHAPRLTVAWPTGEIGGMGFEGLVNLGMKNQLESIEDPEERQAAFDAAVNKLYERGKALTSASHLEFDAVIDPADTRSVLIQAMDAAPPVKGNNPIDTW